MERALCLSLPTLWPALTGAGYLNSLVPTSMVTEFLLAKKHYIHFVLMISPIWSPFYSRTISRSQTREVAGPGFEPRLWPPEPGCLTTEPHLCTGSVSAAARCIGKASRGCCPSISNRDVAPFHLREVLVLKLVCACVCVGAGWWVASGCFQQGSHPAPAHPQVLWGGASPGG